MTRVHQHKIRRLIAERTGLVLSHVLEQHVYEHIVIRAAESEAAGMDRYVEALEDPHATEWGDLLDLLLAHGEFDFDAGNRLQRALDRVAHVRARIPHIWICGCGFGESAYSAAFFLAEQRDCREFPARIVATDVHPDALAAASAGVYPLRCVTRMARDRASRFFLRGTGGWSKFARVRSEYRQTIEFRRLDIGLPVWPAWGPFDVIFVTGKAFGQAGRPPLLIRQRLDSLLRDDGVVAWEPMPWNDRYEAQTSVPVRPTDRSARVKRRPTA